ncbi:MAG: PilZ domain-containing protein [Deltaproteobacteria bacterium]|nr:PilZ domain-containing protein [Deltaproteobacteria bacterium]
MVKAGDKRRFLRIGRDVPIEVNRLSYPVDDSTSQGGQGRDVSGGGMKFWVPVPYEPRARLMLSIRIPGEGVDAPALSAVAEVVWCMRAERREGYEVGIRFVDMAAEDYRTLKRFIESASHNEDA